MQIDIIDHSSIGQTFSSIHASGRRPVTVETSRKLQHGEKIKTTTRVQDAGWEPVLAAAGRGRSVIILQHLTSLPINALLPAAAQRWNPCELNCRKTAKL
ncbi:hypothetical protein CRENBAI_003392 [Crenichthys baileyi]|uniref:Uncharacterized protein n=1 Tax=Crenichthys baileyi TaxID=28760 RepID=A0AAV9RGY0_9TELE